MDWCYIVWGIIVVIFLHSGYVFTRKLPQEPNEGTDCIVAIVRYGYFWILFLLLVGVAPFFFFLHDRDVALYEDAPIHVVNGCRVVDLEGADDKPDRPCGEDMTQWWLNIGGLSEVQGSVPKDVKETLDQAITAMGTALDKSSKVPSNKQDQIKQAQNDLKALTQTSKQFVISGGLSVPLYMIIIALLGGLISMTRRIPEFQKRGSLGYRATYADSLKVMEAKGISEFNGVKKNDYPLEPERVREYVIFQMMQAATAPLLAATVYALIDLKSTASVVAMGFISGFASESVLLQIRKAADAVAGQFSNTVTSKPEAASDSQKAGMHTEKVPKTPDEAAQQAVEVADNAKK